MYKKKLYNQGREDTDGKCIFSRCLCEEGRTYGWKYIKIVIDKDGYIRTVRNRGHRMEGENDRHRQKSN